MESTNEKTRRSRGSGRFGDEQKRLRESGKAYKTRKLKPVPEKPAPSQQVCCKCQFACKSLGCHWRRSLFENFYKQNSHVQGSYLMNLNTSGANQKTYENPEESKRQTTVSYTIPGESGDFVQVCKKTVMDTFAVTRKKIDGLVSKKKAGATFYSDKRTCHKTSKFLKMIPRDVGHYTRAKSDKEYLSPDLNLHRLFKAFIKLYPESANDFPKLSFRRPRMDTCHTCDRLDCEIRANNELSKAAKTKLAIQHAKAERARDILKENTITSQQPGSDLCCLSMDLEQVLFVPTLVHSDMFYLSQLSCFNFGIHVGDTNHASMFLWHEGFSGRGANEIASCLLRFLNSGFTNKKTLVLWCNNCGGQNKNKFILFTLIFLVSIGLLDAIEQRFLVSGHSFMP
nr:unnamed protein product [Callosobruchus analis]